MGLLSTGDRDELLAGARRLGVPLAPEQADRLVAQAELMLKWNKAINLTATTAPREVVEKHHMWGMARTIPTLPLLMMLQVKNGKRK